MLYGAALAVALLWLGTAKDRQYRLVLTVYLLILGVFAFFYKPYITADLYRLREYISYWTNKSVPNMIKYAVKHSNPTWVVYAYFLNKLGNENWLQTVTCLWGFANVFYIVRHEIERNNLKRRERSLQLFLVMAVGALYLQTISGIRSMLGISIIAMCFYRETIEDKNILVHFPLYLFACLLHSACMILTASRFAFLFIKRKKNMGDTISCALAIAVLPVGLVYLAKYIAASFSKGLQYLTNQSQYVSSWETLIGLIEIMETVYILVSYWKCRKSSDFSGDEMPIWWMCLAWTVLSVLLLPFSYSIFRRYSIFATIIAECLLGRVVAEKKAAGEDSFRFSFPVWAFSAVIFAISVVRGDLCGYKFFVL